MSVAIHIIDGPLQDATNYGAQISLTQTATNIGATLVFEGVVRALEGARHIRALEYEAYEPMASRTLAGLAQDILAKLGLISITVEHSCGQVSVGERSFRLSVQSAHRKEALAATDEFITRMKCDVPIWKSPVYS